MHRLGNCTSIDRHVALLPALMAATSRSVGDDCTFIAIACISVGIASSADIAKEVRVRWCGFVSIYLRVGPLDSMGRAERSAPLPLGLQSFQSSRRSKRRVNESRNTAGHHHHRTRSRMRAAAFAPWFGLRLFLASYPRRRASVRASAHSFLVNLFEGRQLGLAKQSSHPVIDRA